jgi:phosphatidylglycerol:prolipoprotein diacylglycerol transferase
MLSSLLAITWNVAPEIFPNSSIHIRWYGLLFAVAFYLGYYILKKALETDKHNVEWADSALMYIMVGTILGARLGHVFFYDWAYYQDNLSEILMIWKGGLASHGAVLGNLVATYIFSKKVTKKSMVWALDRFVLSIIVGAALVRFGNFMNSEIIGKPTGTDFGVIFERIDGLVRHPAQLYEAFSYLVISAILLFTFFKTDKKKQEGFLFGAFLTLLFIARFFIELFKENQVAFEDGMTLNMGQWLSIPFILIGLYFTFLHKKNERLTKE